MYHACIRAFHRPRELFDLESGADEDMKYRIFAAALAAATLPLAAPLSAQEALAVGDVVTGPEGNDVGTITKIENGTASLDTGNYDVALPVTSFGTSADGPTITVTKAQLDGMVEAQMEDMSEVRDSLLVAGATVSARGGDMLGTIESVEGDTVTVAHSDGPIVLERSMFTARDGALFTRYTAEQIADAVNGSDDDASDDEAGADDAM